MQNLQSDHKIILDGLKQEQIAKIKQRQEDKILEKENAEFLIKLIENAESKEDVLKLSALGMSLKRTGFHFDVRLEKSDRTIKYFVKNEKLSFEPLGEAESTKESDSKILDEKLAFSSDCARSYLKGNDEAQSCRIADLSLKAESQKITHTLIIGDNYPALLNLLIEYRGKVKVIYIDPPYGKDDLGEFATTNYDNAITRDNLLSMLYPRLCLAKMLLQDDGAIFCSIDDKNQAYVKGLFDEVFGEGNFVANLPRLTIKGGKTQTDLFTKNLDYILCYATKIDNITFNKISMVGDSAFKYSDKYENERGKYHTKQALDTSSLGYVPSLDYPITHNEITYYPGGTKEQNGFRWTWSKDMYEFALQNDFVEFKNNRIFPKKYEFASIEGDSKNGYFIELTEKQKNYSQITFVDNIFSNRYGDSDLESLNMKKAFKYPKPVNLIKHLLKISTTNPSDYVDFACHTEPLGEVSSTESTRDISCLRTQYDKKVDSQNDNVNSYDNATTTGGGGTLAA